MAWKTRDLFGNPKSAGDNLVFLQARWTLGLWIAVTVCLHWGQGWNDWAGLVVVGAFMLSQWALWKMKAGFLKGLQLHTAVFVLDLLFTILALIFTNQAKPALLAVLFLSIFITALVAKPSLSLLVSGVSILMYILFKSQGPGGLDFSDLRQLLDLPFIVLSSLHAAIVVSEAQFHEDITQALDMDNQTLLKKLNSSATELKARVYFIKGAFDAVPAATLVIDGEGMLRTFNSRAEELFGVGRIPLLDRPMKDQEFFEPLREALRKLNGEGDAVTWLRGPKKDWFYASLRCGIAKDPEGRLANMVVFVQATEPPAESPTYESWVESKRHQKLTEVFPDRRIPAQAPAGAGNRNPLIREIADTVEHDQTKLPES